MDFKIRPATEEHLPQMVQLWREMMDFHGRHDERFRPKSSPQAEEAWTRHLREDIWPSDRWRVLVAEQGTRVVGQILGELRERSPAFEPGTYGCVTDIVVDPQARRRGVGEALFHALGAWFREHGASHIQLHVMHANPTSQAFWRAMGFRDALHMLWYDVEAE